MKYLRKLFACMLVLAMVSSMTLTLHAQESNVTATVIATNEPSYQITIPTTISAENLNRTAESSYHKEEFTISVSEIDFLNGKQICVRVYAENGVFELCNADRSGKLAFEVYSTADTENALQSGDIFATFTEPASQDGYIQIDTKNIVAEDTYSGNLSFAFFITDAE